VAQGRPGVNRLSKLIAPHVRAKQQAALGLDGELV
jgi:hypothetical protein